MNTNAVLALPTNNVLAPMTQISVIKGAYVQHPHTSARNFAAIQSVFGRKPCNETTPVLIDANSITPLEPLDFFMTPYYKQYYAESDSVGNYVRTTPITTTPTKGMKECIDSLIICILQVDGVATFAPARMRLKAGKCKILTAAYDHLIALDAKDKKLGALTKLGLAPYNFLHFTPQYAQETAKVSKKLYFVGNAAAEQTTPELAKELMAAMKNPDFIQAFNTAVEGYNETAAIVDGLSA